MSPVLSEVVLVGTPVKPHILPSLKAREHEWKKIDENRRAVGMVIPMSNRKQGMGGGGEGRHL